MRSKVCILTAGHGLRLGDYTKFLNKALIPLKGKAVISHIIEKFPADSEFVIAVGHKREQVVDYLKLAHPNQKISIVNVDNYAGNGAGPGTSLLACREATNELPFYFVTCDTLWTDDVTKLPVNQSWWATAAIPEEETPSYCNALIKNGLVIGYRDKIFTRDETARAFTGLAHIYDTSVFWESLKNKSHLISGEKQAGDGFSELIEKHLLHSYQINWIDVGTKKKYEDQIHNQGQYDFSKVDEGLYFVNSRVIKFFNDKRISELRTKKSFLNLNVFPKVIDHSGQFYCYDYVKGETLYRYPEENLFENLLGWLDKNLWIKKNVSNDILQSKCREFYYDKTLSRIKMYNENHQHNIDFINGEKIPDTSSLLKSIDWDSLFAGEAYFIHGDLQPDNIIYDSTTERFSLLDWRHEFAGEIEYGDIYYDLAKLKAGMLLNYDQIKKNNFSYKEENNRISFSYPSHPNAQRLINKIDEFVTKKKLSLDKVNLLVGLIYLNMSPLHFEPFDQLLHALGRTHLHSCINK